MSSAMSVELIEHVFGRDLRSIRRFLSNKQVLLKMVQRINF